MCGVKFTQITYCKLAAYPWYICTHKKSILNRCDVLSHVTKVLCRPDKVFALTHSALEGDAPLYCILYATNYTSCKAAGTNRLGNRASPSDAQHLHPLISTPQTPRPQQQRRQRRLISTEARFRWRLLNK